MLASKVAPGVRVRLTGDFLHNTGQFYGSECFATWTVVDCNCGLCTGKMKEKYVAVNEPSCFDPTRPRHINAANLEISPV